MDKPLVSFDKVTLLRGDRVLVQGLSWALASGQIWALRGDNGAGKTSLLRTAAGLLSPFAGQVERNPNLSFLGHELALKPHDLARDYLAEERLEAWGLEGFADIPLVNLSAGQRKRLALARACRTDALLWLLDEPFAHIDSDQAQRLEGRIHDHADRGGGILFSTHEPRKLGQNLTIGEGQLHRDG